MQVLQLVLSQRAVLLKYTPTPLWSLISSQGDAFEPKFLNTINSDYIILDIRTSSSYLVRFSSIFCSLGGSRFSSFQKIDSCYLLACPWLRDSWVLKIEHLNWESDNTKTNGEKLGRGRASFILPPPPFPRSWAHNFACLSLTSHPYYLTAWNMLGICCLNKCWLSQHNSW